MNESSLGRSRLPKSDKPLCPHLRILEEEALMPETRNDGARPLETEEDFRNASLGDLMRHGEAMANRMTRR